MKNVISIALLILVGFLGLSQEMPPLINYAPKDYKAGNQNWMISQDENHFIYFANNDGLLQYNGSSFKIYPLPNKTILRSVKCIEERIYTGAYMTFGYWLKQENGVLKYIDLSAKIKNKLLEDEQFWNIEKFEHWILFQSLDRIYVYDKKNENIKIISPKNKIYKLFKTNQGIFFHNKDGLFEIENSQSKLLIQSPDLNNDKMVQFIEYNKKNYIFMQRNGIFLFENNQLIPFKTEVDQTIKDGVVYSASLINENQFAIGTISQGLIILNNNGQFISQLKQGNGLLNNTVLSIFEDHDKNIWLGLDNGINCINYNSPIRNYEDNSGLIGTVYASIIFNNKLYIGSNQGLFCKPYPSNDNFKFVSGTKGQVWSLFNHDNTLFCGHDSGTFLIKDYNSQNIYSQSGTWKFESINNKVIQGNYNGLSVLEKVNGQYQFKNKIEGFNFSAKYFELTAANQIIINHEYKGVFILKHDEKFIKILENKLYKNLSKSKNSGLVKFKNTVFYASEHGIYKFINNDFVNDIALSNIIKNDTYTTGKMIVENDKLWLFTKNYIYYFLQGKLSDQLVVNSLSIPSAVTNSMPGYENLSYLENNEYLIGTANGYYIINPQEFKYTLDKVFLTKAQASMQKNHLIDLDINKPNEVKYTNNNLSFELSIPFYNKYINAEYQYFLEGFDSQWSNWTTNPSINYGNLPTGEYIFYVKGKLSNQMTPQTSSIKITILPPWYKSFWAKIFYLLIFFLTIYLAHKYYDQYHNEKHNKIIAENNLLLELKELENQKELMKFQNKQLNEFVEKKDKELAISNLNLVKKTELLNIIKDDLKSTEDINEKGKIKRIIQSINKDNKEEDTWQMFKEAFDKADHDFLKIMKQKHASLTPNDLRLCAYLRINLTSKEIAPLLNISVRSVEIKRYRLRKKMDLTHEQGLTEYILSI